MSDRQITPGDDMPDDEDAAGEDERGMYDDELKKESEVAWQVDREGDRGESA